MKWADDLLLGAVQAHMPNRQETLEHIFMAEWLWLARVHGTASPAPPATPADLATAWVALHEEWLSWAAGVSDWSRVMPYKTLAGVESDSPLWQVVLHVANHGSYHRGQVAAMLRAAGFTPPGTDLITWYRLNSE